MTKQGTDSRLRLEGRRRLLLVALTVLLAAAAVAALLAGRFPATVGESLTALFSDGDTPLSRILLDVRLPRIATALLVGAGLSAAGAAFQALFSNPLASPDTLGVATGSAFGAVLAMLLGFSGAGIQGLSLVSGLAAMALVMVVAAPGRREGLLMLVLAGMIVGALSTALISLVKLVADPQDELPGIVYWIMGSLTGSTWRSLASGAPAILAGSALLLAMSWRLNLLSLPEDEARSLGVKTGPMRTLVILAATLVTASAVSMTGLIGWVGLIIPHLARLLTGTSENRHVVPVSMVLGALFLLLADTAARTVLASEIPVAVITSLIGAPLFLAMLMRSASKRF